MKNIYNWHKNFTEKKRLYWDLSHYQAYWISWFKGIVMGLIIAFLVLCL